MKGNLTNVEENANHGLYAQAHFCGCIPWQGEAALTERTLWELLSVLSIENTHTQGQERTSFPEAMTPLLVPQWQGQQWGMKKRMILLMFTWFRQVPQGFRVVSLECDVHCTVLISLKYATALEPFPVCRGLWFALWPQESSLAVPIVLYHVKKVLHPNNVN